MQRLVDKIQVIVIDDCSTNNFDYIIESFSKLLDIKYYKNNINLGVGATRQRGIELCNTKYLMFCDADDAFYNEYSVLMLYNEIVSKQMDIVSGGFIQECKSSDNIKTPLLTKVNQENQTWIWSRIFLVDFLIKNKVTFSDLRYNEDVVFMSHCLALNPKTSFVKNMIYVWHYNEKSITRSKGGVFSEKVWRDINLIDALIQSHIVRKKNNLLNEIALSQICDSLCVCYWYFLELYEIKSPEIEKYIEKMQEYYNLISDDYSDIMNCKELKESYFNSSYTLESISKNLIPRFSLYDVLEDLEDNKKEVKDVSKYGYEIG